LFPHERLRCLLHRMLPVLGKYARRRALGYQIVG
jgi:hypothetical protein